MRKPLCIYHHNCIDGFGAAWVVRRAFGDGNVDFHPGIYGEPLPEIDGRDVILVDFSYKRPVMEDLIGKAVNVVILDHHKTAEAELSGLDDRAIIRFDQEHSGAMLAWNFYFPDEPAPLLLRHIEDRDLWRFRLCGTRQITAALFSHPYDFQVWDCLMPCDKFAIPQVDQLRTEGQAIERKHHKDVRELVTASARPMLIGGHQVLAANLPYTFSSDAGHLLMEDGNPFGACYFDGPNGRTFSLRSSDSGPDVSEIAKLYGGGGHRNAAGFRVALSDLAQFELPTR